MKSLTPFLKKILLDYRSGSQELNEKVLMYLLKRKSTTSVLKAIEIFKSNFQIFQIIQINLVRIEKYLKKNGLGETKKFIRIILTDYNRKIKKISTKIDKIVNDKSIILTFSNSKTVKDVIIELNEKKDIKVFSLESNPGGEGKILYKSLKVKGIKVKLIKDAKLLQIVKNCDYVFIGADKIIDRTYFINKIGTSDLCKISKKFKKPVILIALKNKIIKNRSAEKFKNSELRKREKNMFEKVSFKLINTFVHD